MDTTQIYDILLTLLSNKNMKLMTLLGVKDIGSGKEKLLTLDAAEVRDLYEDCRPTPKPRRNKNADLLRQVWNIREARCIRNAIREKIQRTPSSQAFHDGLHSKCRMRRTPFIPPSYKKFFTKKDGSVMPNTKKNVELMIRRYSSMKQYTPALLHNNNYGRLISIYYRKKNKSDGWYNTEKKILMDDGGIYSLLDFMYKNKLFNKSPSLSWHDGLP